MNTVPDAWDEEWSTAADIREPAQSTETEPKKLSSKQTKAQKRAAQAEFNRQLWAEAEGPQETNYFLESRNVVPLRQEFKAPPTLLSRKGPIIQKARPNIEAGVEGLKLKDRDESSEDEDDKAAQQKALEDAKAQAAKDREEKQRKYEERRLELFGPSTGNTNSNGYAGRPNSQSGGSTPTNLTPPGSRSSTPHRGGKRGRGRGNYGAQNSLRPQQPQYQQYQQQQLREVYDPGYAAKPNSTYLMRREQGHVNTNRETQPIREPKAPDGSGRGGAGFVQRRSTLSDGTAQTAQTYQ
ncbi:hypothetical protein PMZ80_000573 [Knufia obscura]|uniref:SUZ domain-containing protein n=2 Tax=Knufia TaxID=430999 RepID=A0AAN8ELJ4_9EURO|nr:hypothetical protein PMZ80_000573 [Knufia obscura]KAK5956500.1 hypothetical protein OHC33_001985 [Knufia fluminis]